jgi:hypothetical protein
MRRSDGRVNVGGDKSSDKISEAFPKKLTKTDKASVNVVQGSLATRACDKKSSSSSLLWRHKQAARNQLRFALSATKHCSESGLFMREHETVNR